MKKIILAAVFLAGISSTFSQKEQVIEEYSIPVFTVTSSVNGPKLYHLAFNHGVIAEVFDSLRSIPGMAENGSSYEMIFEKVRLFGMDGTFEKTELRFKKVTVGMYPAVRDCEYIIPCYTCYSFGGGIKAYPVLGEFSDDVQLYWFLYNYLFFTKLEPGMRYLITLRESWNETGERMLDYVSCKKSDYILITKRNSITGQ